MSFARFATVFAILATASMLYAQENRASISGQVTDSSGAAVPSAAIKIVNVEQGTVKAHHDRDFLAVSLGWLIMGCFCCGYEFFGGSIGGCLCSC